MVESIELLEELIREIHDASEPSRGLDASIHTYLLPGLYSRHYCHSWAPAYVTNLNDALSLVPKGYDWIVGNTNDGLTPYACVGDLVEHFGATPCLSLCLAALRARLLDLQQPSTEKADQQ